MFILLITKTLNWKYEKFLMIVCLLTTINTQKRLFCKSKIWLSAQHSTSFLRFWNKFPTYHRSSLEMADSYSFMGDVCPVFTSPPLIPPNWSCLQRDSVSTHRRRHRIRYLPLSPLNLNLVHTLGKISSCLSSAVQCSVFANKSGHCAPWSEKTSFVHLTTFSSR